MNDDNHDDAQTTEPIPKQLRDRDNWVVWRYEERDGDTTKVPYDPKTGDNASTTDPETWTGYEDAQACAERDNVDGLGFVFDADDTLVGVDLDDCRDPETGALDAWARDALDEIETYTEVSPSGTGLHLIGLGFAPDDGNRTDVANTDGHLEIYDSSRFFTVTGDHVDGTPTTVEQVHQEVHGLFDRHTEDSDPAEGGSTVATPTPSASETGLSDGELLEKARSAKNGEKFAALWDGSTTGYPSHSEADLALASLLAFWTGNDKAEVDRLFRRSGLYREKWERDDYRERTLSKACERKDVYTPGGRNTKEVTIDIEADGSGVDLLSPEEVCAVAGLDEDGAVVDLNDRERAAAVWEILTRSDDYHVAVRRDNGAIWAFEDGTWKETGENILAEAARAALGPAAYGANVLAELKAQVRADPRAKIDADEWGVETGTLAVANGLLDLDDAADGAGKEALRDLRPEDYALAQLPVDYDPEAVAEEWVELVEEWAERDRASALQEYVGYCLHTGDMPIHRALMVVGGGANGKSTFLGVVGALLGDDNTTSVPLQRLAERDDAVARFHGALANIDNDLSARGIEDGLGTFKQLVSGDRVHARRLYEEGFSFHATGKQLYGANQVPNVDVSDEDEAFWRRWLLVEFPNHYSREERDPALGARLTKDENLSGVLNWAIEGRARLLAQGYFTGEEEYAQAKRERWQKWGDSVDQFVSACISRDTDADKISSSDVYAIYTEWCRRRGERPAAQQKLTIALKKLGVGYSSSVRVDGKVTRGFKALALSQDAPALDDVQGDDDHDPGQSRFN